MISVEALTASVVARLVASDTPSTHVDVFDAVVKAEMDGDGLAHPYVTVHASPGQADRMPLADHADALLWTFQTTCAGGDPVRARRALDRTRNRLNGARLAVDGAQVGIVQEPEFYTAGPLREDREVQPSRWYTVLQWELYAIPSA